MPLFYGFLSLLMFKTGIINRNAYETNAYDVIQFIFNLCDLSGTLFPGIIKAE